MFGTKTVKVEVSKREDLDKIKSLEDKLVSLRKDYESDKRIQDREIKVKISEAVEEKDKENNTLKQTNAVLLKEVEILKKAFENMGFDVKDMKDILNKLVDGIVSKNEIKLVK